MDMLEPGASPEYALQCIKWCAEKEEIAPLATHIENHKGQLKDELVPVLFDALSKHRTGAARAILSALDPEFRTVYKEGEKSWLQKLFLNAIEQGNVDIVRDLIEKGANVNVYHYGKPVLHLAACYGHSEIVEELIKAGSDVTFVDGRGAGIIQSTLTSQLPEKNKMVQQLISLGADPLVKSSSGKLPIHLAAKNSQDVLAMFIQEGHDVNIPDDVNKDTPLHIACGAACQETILTLIQGGCLFNTENNQGQTPLAKLLRFTGKDHDFHAKTRLTIAKQLISIGFRMSKQKFVHSKGRDKVYDRYTSLRLAMCTPPCLQNLSRLAVRQSLTNGINTQLEIDNLDIPQNLKPYLLCHDFKIR